MDGNVRVIVPAVPAGSTQPCCQPLTTIGVSCVPSAVCATQPGFTLSGTTSTRDRGDGSVRTSRRSGPHAPICTRVVAAGGGTIGDVMSAAPSTTKPSPGLISSSWVPAGSAIGFALAGLRGDRLARQ